MKIVAGKYGGRRLITPKNRDIRPTSDKVRGAIFNMLASRSAIEGAFVLDAFCGTGALGLESLSRGAFACVFMDKSRTSLALVRENAALLDVGREASYVCGDARKIAKLCTKAQKGFESVQGIGQHPKAELECGENMRETYGRRNEQYSLVFLDPPYDKGLISEIVPLLMDAGMLYDGAWLVCESERNFCLQQLDKISLDSEKIYGDTKVSLLQYSKTYTA